MRPRSIRECLVAISLIVFFAHSFCFADKKEVRENPIESSYKRDSFLSKDFNSSSSGSIESPVGAKDGESVESNKNVISTTTTTSTTITVTTSSSTSTTLTTEKPAVRSRKSSSRRFGRKSAAEKAKEKRNLENGATRDSEVSETSVRENAADVVRRLKKKFD